MSPVPTATVETVYALIDQGVFGETFTVESIGFKLSPALETKDIAETLVALTKQKRIQLFANAPKGRGNVYATLSYAPPAPTPDTPTEKLAKVLNPDSLVAQITVSTAKGTPPTAEELLDSWVGDFPKAQVIATLDDLVTQGLIVLGDDDIYRPASLANPATAPSSSPEQPPADLPEDPIAEQESRYVVPTTAVLGLLTATGIPNPHCIAGLITFRHADLAGDPTFEIVVTGRYTPLPDPATREFNRDMVPNHNRVTGSPPPGMKPPAPFNRDMVPRPR
jgi:hypothetical protein